VDGRLGDGSPSVDPDLFTAPPEPAPVDTDVRFARLSASATHTCGLTPDGEAHCWGSNERGQLGDGTTTDRVRPVPAVPNRRFVSVATGSEHTCGLQSDGTPYCWGASESGQLGETFDEVMRFRLQAVRVDVPEPLRELSAGGRHTCGLSMSGAVYCWGGRAHDRLDGAARTGGLVRQIATEMSAVWVGSGHTCARSLDGRLWCWGTNGFGELGDGSRVESLTPVAVALPS
jgi:alpha-tubulin suppressor-like RCC1 family protein